MNPQRPNVILVGTGVVGRAILKAHLDAGVSVRLADQDLTSLESALDHAEFDSAQWRVSEVEMLGGTLPSISIAREEANSLTSTTVLVESISEKLDIKRDFFREASRWFDERTVLASNTSTLRIAQISEGNPAADRICGMHFFMPVVDRPAVELVRGQSTADWVVAAGTDHIQRIGKSPLQVADSPGFVVNRLLSPYLNEAMLMLCRGVPAEQIEQAAHDYGMPMSPLELIDLIGTRTMFDAGRAFWQAYPQRFDPAPVLGALIKAKRAGRICGHGFYDYEQGRRSADLSPVTAELCQRYHRNPARFRDAEVMLHLAIPMWIEAAHAYRERVVTSLDQFDLAMEGGLGYQSEAGWLAFFDRLGSDRILDFIGHHQATSKSLQIARDLIESLRQTPPRDALAAFAA